MFDKEKAEKQLKQMLKHYRIKVIKWSVGSNGYAYPDSKEVKIPHPETVDRFCVAMHEIKHVIDGIWGKLYEREFACEMFAIEQAELLGFDCSGYRERARRYIIMNIAKGYCRKLNLDNISQPIKDFCGIDFELWKGKKVFVTNFGKATYEGKELQITIN